MKKPEKKTVYTIIVTVLAWALVGWLLISLRNYNEAGQVETSTLLLRILCAGASLLLLMTCVIVAIGLHQMARDAETEDRFPPASALHWKSIAEVEGEQAWLFAARLRGWAAGAIALGLIVAGIGLGISVRVGQIPVLPETQAAPVRFSAGLVADRQSAHPASPARSTGAPG